MPCQQYWLISMVDNWNGRGLHPQNGIRQVLCVYPNLLSVEVMLLVCPMCLKSITQVVSLGRQYQIVGLLEAAAVAEEELLDELFAVSLQTKLLSSEEEKTTTIPLDGQSDNVTKSLTNDTADSSVQLDNASSRKVSISLVENINNEAAENNSRTLDTDEDEDMTEADEATCENCDCIACKDGEVDCSDICAPDLQVVSGNREHIRVWRKAWLPGEIFPFCNLCPGRQGQPQEHHLLHPQLQLRGQFCLSCCTLISCFAMQLDNTSVPLKMLCNMERTFQACMPQMLGIPIHSILNQVAVANCVTSYWGNGYRAQRGEV